MSAMAEKGGRRRITVEAGKSAEHLHFPSPFVGRG